MQIVGIDETSLRRGQHYITVVHDLDANRLLFATEGRDHQTVLDFAADLKAHRGDPAGARRVCMDMRAAYAKGTAEARVQVAPSSQPGGLWREALPGGLKHLVVRTAFASPAAMWLK